MKLFAAIASTAVIGSSFLAPNSASAQSKWTNHGQSKNYILYINDSSIKRRGEFVRYQSKSYNKSTKETRVSYREANCSIWKLRFQYTDDGSWSKWENITQGTGGDGEMHYVCKSQ